MMHGHEKSYSAIVAKKLPNKAGQPAAEAVERPQPDRSWHRRSRCRVHRTVTAERKRGAQQPSAGSLPSAPRASGLCLPASLDPWKGRRASGNALSTIKFISLVRLRTRCALGLRTRYYAPLEKHPLDIVLKALAATISGVPR